MLVLFTLVQQVETVWMFYLSLGFFHSFNPVLVSRKLFVRKIFVCKISNIFVLKYEYYLFCWLLQFDFVALFITHTLFQGNFG